MVGQRREVKELGKLEEIRERKSKRCAGGIGGVGNWLGNRNMKLHDNSNIKLHDNSMAFNYTTKTGKGKFCN